MATNMDILGVAAEWEAIRSIRDRVRDRGVLFEDFVGGKKMECNIHGAEYHAEILLPVLKKLVDPESGDVGMCGIPLSKESFWRRFQPLKRSSSFICCITFAPSSDLFGFNMF